MARCSLHRGVANAVAGPVLCSKFVSDREEPRFHVEQPGFNVAEDRQFGDYHRPLVQAPDNTEYP